MNFRKIKNRVMSCLLVLCMVMGFMPVQNVLAANTTYTYQQLYDRQGSLQNPLILYRGDYIQYSEVTVAGSPTTDYNTETVDVLYYGPNGGKITNQLIKVPNDGTVTDLQIKELTHNGVVYNSWRLTQFSPSQNNITLWLHAESKTNSITTNVNGGNGTINAPKTAKGGETVTFTVAPEKDYEFDFSSIVKKPAGLVITPVENRHNQYTFTMPNEPVEITGSFKKIGKYKINITGGTAWDADYNEVTEAAAGEFINITPADWDTFDHWDADCTLNWESTEPGNDFIMPNQDVNIIAVSKGAETNHKVTVQNDGNGKASANLTTAKKGDKIALTATPNNGYRFKEWQVISGGVKVTNNEFTMPDGDVTVKAIFEEIPAPTYSVTVQNDGNGTASADLTSAKKGEKVKLTATPKNGYQFKEWQVISGSVSVTNNEFTMLDGDVTVKAIFEEIPAPTYSVTVQNDGNGTASADIATAKKGDTVKLTATPNKGYRFKEWQVIEGGVSVNNNEFTMMGANVVVKAIFEKIPTYSITVENDGNGSGTATPSIAKKGDKVTLTAAPNKDYRFKEWQVISGGITVDNNEFTMPGKDVTIKAVFEKIPAGAHKVTVQNDGNGSGAATPDSAKQGEKVKLTATPNKGYQFKEWQVISGGITITNNEFTMLDKDVTVKAVFEEIPEPTYNVTVQNDGNGSGTATPSAAKKGDKVTLAATPNNGYQFKEWQVISGGVTITNNEFTMLNENVTVKAVFEKKTEPINPQPTAPTITSGENGTHQIGTGENLLFTFSEALNGLIGVYVDGKAVDPSNYMMNMYNTALSLKSGYLDTLPAGKHTLIIRCADDISVSTEFTVKSKAASNTTGDNKTKTDVKKANTVQTGDTTNISLYLCLLSLSAIAIYIMAHLKKRKFW